MGAAMGAFPTMADPLGQENAHIIHQEVDSILLPGFLATSLPTAFIQQVNQLLPGVFLASYLVDKKKVSLPVISKLLRHKNLQTTERYLQAIDPRFRDTLRLLEGALLTDPLTKEKGGQKF